MSTKKNTNFKNLSPIKQALLKIDKLQRKLKEVQNSNNDPIAVIGMSGRFPKAKNVSQFWDLLVNNVDAISEIPNERWDLEKYFSSTTSEPGKMISKWGGFIDDFDKFDNHLFNISPREADKMDPQQRLLLEVAWEAFENAGINQTEISGSKTGVFIGISTNDYSFVQSEYSDGDKSIADAYLGSGNASSISANRLSYFYDLHGPSLSIDTACSSSLVSLHLACESIRNNQSEIALAGGVNMILTPEPSISFSQAQMLAPNGRCRTFDANAEGYVRGEGVGIIVLKRLSQAIKDDDNILAVVKSTAVNQDGRTNGLTAPNSASQYEVINEALQKANLKADDIGFIETHGTGTILGDPIEVESLGRVMVHRNQNDKCYLGAVKSNIGHLESAAGIAGVIKTILVLKNKLIPANINYKSINPHIPIDKLPFEIPTKNIEWVDHKRFAGVSSFGFGGTNAHAILESFENNANDRVQENTHNLFALSADNTESLRKYAENYFEYLKISNEALNDICYTTNVSRTNLNSRFAISISSRDELAEHLQNYSKNEIDYDIILKNDDFERINKIAFMFTGQGSQYSSMAKELYENNIYIRDEFDKCFEIANKYIDQNLKEIIFIDSHNKISETEFTQPALFILEYVIAKYVMELGINPDYLIGHSVGEIAAACIAEVFTLEEGIKLISIRSKLMQSLPKIGGMIAVFDTLQNVEEKIENLNIDLSVASYNGPNNIVVSGKLENIDQIVGVFQKDNIDYRKLDVSHAFHSSLMEPILQEFEEAVSDIQFKTPKIPIVSNVSGKLIGSGEIQDKKYWRNHISEKVNFFEGMEELRKSNVNTFIEIGPNPILIGMAKRFINDPSILFIGSLKKEKDDLASINKLVGELFVNGCSINWKSFYNGIRLNKITLPNYPFQKNRFYPERKVSLNDKLKNIDTSDLKLLLVKDNDNSGAIKIINKAGNVIFDLSNIEIDSNISEEEFRKISVINNEDEDLQTQQLQEQEIEKFDLDEIIKLSVDEQKLKIVKYLIRTLAKILRVNPSKINSSKSVTAFGLDSIMAIELKNKLENKFNQKIAIADLIRGISLDEISQILVENLSTETNEQTEVEVINPFDVRPGKYELSYGQKAMWFQHQMAPDSIFNPTYAIKINQELDVERFKGTFEKIISRHLALKTLFINEGGKNYQVIQESIIPPFAYHELNDKSDIDINKFVNEKAQEKFDLINGPVIKPFLFKISENKYIFLISAHHIAVDFWSQAILVNEISHYYSNDNDLPELKYSYLDFVNWQKEFISSEEGRKQLEFWKNKLSDEIPHIDLPTKKTRKPVQTFNGSKFNFSLSKSVTEKLKLVSKENNATLYSTLFTLFKVLLNKYTHQTDIIVGTPSTGRTRKEFNETIGYFVNPLPIRTKFDSSENFTDVLAKVKTNVIEALSNQDYPFNLIVDSLKVERDPSRTPIFQVMFVYQKAQLLDEEGLSSFTTGDDNSLMKLADIEIESYKLEENKSVFDLTLMMADTNDGINASITYNTDLFDEIYIERLSNHLLHIADSVIEQANIKLSNIQLVEETEKFNFDDLNNLPFYFAHKEFEKVVVENSDKYAVRFKNNTLTYFELNKRSNQLANFLLNKNLEPETKIGVFVERSFEMITSILAIMKAGFVYVPIDTIYPDERIEDIVNDANINILISHKQHCEKLSVFNKEVVCLDNNSVELEKCSEKNPNVKLDKKSLAYSIYTSGSTGKPKGVLLTHIGLANLVVNQTQIFEIEKNSTVLQLASLSFDASVSEIFTTLVKGATLHLVTQDVLLSGSALLGEINSQDVSVATIPPSLLAVLPHDKIAKLKTLVSAGELCTQDIVNKWKNGRKFINAYGPTETTVCATTYDIPTEINSENVPIGKSIDRMHVYVLDAFLNQVPTCVPGELYIAGIGLARGYNKSPKLTAEKFIPNPFSSIPGERLYKTGDLVRRCENGNLEFLGRIDDQIKFRGFRIELAEIQSVLENHPEIIKAELVLKKIKNDKKLIAFYISTSQNELDKNNLRDYVIEHLPEYMLPSNFVKVDHIPLTSNGKVNKKELEKLEVLEERKEFEKPTSEVESDVINIWKEILQIEAISTNDNFFELGGHSLNVIQVQEKIKEHFNKDLTVVDLFKYPTVKLFANYLSNGNNIGDQVKIVKDRVDKQRNLLTQQQKMRDRRKSI